MVIVIAGPPCAGKSTIAAALAQRLGVAHLSMDGVRQRILPGAAHTREDRQVAYRAMLLAAELLHAAGVGVILDAPYGHQEDREAVQELEPLWVECRVSAEEAVRRFRERGFDRERPDLTEDVVRRAVAEYKYSGGALVLDTEQIDLEDCVERVTGELRRLSKGQARRPTKRVTPEG